MAYNTREEWLSAAVKLLTPMIEREVGLEVPNLRISAGFGSPRAFARKNPAVGACHGVENSTDGTFELFVSPIQAVREEVLETVLHEMLHAVVGVDAGHKGAFVKAAKAVGFEKPWTSTPASEELKDWLLDIAMELGEYPHAAMVLTYKEKKQTTRMLKCACEEPADGEEDHACGYTVRATRKWLKKAGAPLCPIHQEAMTIDDPEGLMDEEEDSGDE